MNTVKTILATAAAFAFLSAPAIASALPPADAAAPVFSRDPLWPRLSELAPTSGFGAEGAAKARLAFRVDSTWPEIKSASPGFTLFGPAYATSAVKASHQDP